MNMRLPDVTVAYNEFRQVLRCILLFSQVCDVPPLPLYFEFVPSPEEHGGTAVFDN